MTAWHVWVPLCLFVIAVVAWAEGGQGQDRKAKTVQGQAGEALIQRGKDLIQQLYCIACHRLPFDKEGEAPPLPAPDFTFEGDKVKPEWLFNFLRRPQSLRPWLEARMPSFWLSDEEALALTEYLMTLRDTDAQPIPEKMRFTGKIPPQSLQAAKMLVSKEYFDCFNCHQQGKKKPEGPPEGWGPDLTFAPQRLNPDWIIRWLEDPQKIQPGTKMPAYFGDAESAPQDILGGDQARQIVALRDYLMSLGKGLDPTGYRRAKANYPQATPELGRRLVEEMNCVGCHRAAALQAPKLKIGPDLTHRHNPVTKGWLLTFLKGPEKVRRPYYLGGARRMPNFRLSAEEAEAIAAYLIATVYPRVEVPPPKQPPAPVQKARETGSVTVR